MKKILLTKLILKLGVNESSFRNRKYSFDTFVNLISQKSYTLADLGLSSSSTNKMLNSLFPNRELGWKIDKWILYSFGYKQCLVCTKIKLHCNYWVDNSKPDKYKGQCIKCSKAIRNTTNEYFKYSRAKYRAAKLQAIPKWANTLEIREFYSKCPEGFHVDHIVPLQGSNVCGLHVINNLQYMLAKDNLSKGNKY